MDLGSGLRRRRGKSRRKKKGGSSAGSRRKKGGWGRVLLKGLVLAAVGLGLGYGIATQVLFPAPPPPGDVTRVPALTGLTVEAARQELAEAGLSLEEADVVRHPAIDSGTVVGQSPLPDQLSLPSTPVRVTVSLGPERREVPEVLLTRDAWAKSLLEATGFTVLADSVESDTIPRGYVAAVEPEAGTELALPGEVALTISLGPPLVSMPRVLGMSELQARDTLNKLGLDLVEVEAVFRFGRDRGIVVEQAPPAESLLEPGAEVRLSVGRGGRDRRR